MGLFENAASAVSAAGWMAVSASPHSAIFMALVTLSASRIDGQDLTRTWTTLTESRFASADERDVGRDWRRRQHLRRKETIRLKKGNEFGVGPAEPMTSKPIRWEATASLQDRIQPKTSDGVCGREGRKWSGLSGQKDRVFIRAIHSLWLCGCASIQSCQQKSGHSVKKENRPLSNRHCASGPLVYGKW